MPIHQHPPRALDGRDHALDLPTSSAVERDLQDLLGNAELLAQLQRQTGESQSSDRRLDRARGQLNDASLDPADRARTLLRYRNSLLSQLSVGSMLKMRKNEPGMPVYGGGDTPGMVLPLYERLAEDPEMQALMADLSTRITSRDEVFQGVAVPAGSLLHLRFGAANADGEAFACPPPIDLDRLRVDDAAAWRFHLLSRALQRGLLLRQRPS